MHVELSGIFLPVKSNEWSFRLVACLIEQAGSREKWKSSCARIHCIGNLDSLQATTGFIPRNEEHIGECDGLSGCKTSLCNIPQSLLRNKESGNGVHVNRKKKEARRFAELAGHQHKQAEFTTSLSCPNSDCKTISQYVAI